MNTHMDNNEKVECVLEENTVVKTFNIEKEEDLSDLASFLIGEAVLFKINHNLTSVVLALKGDLGAGKTTLTKLIANKLGVEVGLSSPTFVIIKKYPINNKNIEDVKNPEYTKGVVFDNLVHIDTYRLNEGKDLEKLGWSEILNTNSIICLEWPEIVTEVIPKKYIEIEILHIFDNKIINPIPHEGELNTEKTNGMTESFGSRKVTVSYKV